ncbi:MAG: formylmethanofuran dehydrogenase subunit C [Asgard group archaeon]|nr:formylmethanofuran dehydrogenase subunit C [Asgard group archaeon]
MVYKMAQITLSQKKPIKKPHLPIEAEVITPDNFSNKTIEEISELILWRGNKQLHIKDLFSIKSNDWSSSVAKDIDIVLTGDLYQFKRIGQKMTAGSIHIKSSIGMHLGYLMNGGKIVVEGNTDDFAGANMKKGELIINGNAGHYLGGSVRGEWRGMNGGKISVNGSVGNETGVWMRNGLIEIKEDAQMFLGMHLHRGSIIVHGNVTERAGAEMTGGTIVIHGKLSKLLPSFDFISEIDEISIDNYDLIKGQYLEFHGDFAERKQGKLFLRKDKNKHHL